MLLCTMDYDQMLERAIDKTTNHTEKGSRFDPPTPDTQEDGAFTLYNNFRSTANYLNRDIKELQTFFKEELATNASLDDSGRVRFKGEFSAQDLKDALDAYVDAYIMCDQCTSPDTKFETQHGVEIIKCTACGATNPKPEH